MSHSRQTTEATLKELLDEADNDGNTPLHLAVNSGHIEVAEFLIKAASKIGATTLIGYGREYNSLNA